MRFFFSFMISTGLLLAISASDANAQWFGNGGRGYQNGFSFGIRSNGNYGNYGNPNYGQGFYGNRGYNSFPQDYNYSNGYFNNGSYYSSPNYTYNSLGYASNSSFYTPSTSLGYTSNGVYYSAPYTTSTVLTPCSGQTVYYPGTTSYSPSTTTYSPSELKPANYVQPSSATSSNITVSVPTMETEVWFGDATTSAQGMDRAFVSPGLEAGQTYTYTIKARWLAEGKTVEQSRKIDVRAGQNTTVQFRSTGRELIPAPDATPSK